MLAGRDLKAAREGVYCGNTRTTPMADTDRTASLMTPSKLAQVKPRGPVSPAAWLDQMAADAFL